MGISLSSCDTRARLAVMVSRFNATPSTVVITLGIVARVRLRFTVVASRLAVILSRRFTDESKAESDTSRLTDVSSESTFGNMELTVGISSLATLSSIEGMASPISLSPTSWLSAEVENCSSTEAVPSRSLFMIALLPEGTLSFLSSDSSTST